MFPGFYIPTGFVKIGIWLEESSPEYVLAVCYKTVLGSSWPPISTSVLAG